MSSGNESSSAPVGSVPPKKNRLLLFGGIGCSLLLLLCGGGLLVAGYFGFSILELAKPEFSAAQAMIESSEEVQSELGSPLTVSGLQSYGRTPTNLQMSGSVEGPNGAGTFTVNLKIEDLKTVTTESIIVEANGKTINVDNDMEDLDIDLGDGF